MAVYECECPECKKRIEVEVDDDWIEEVANSWWQERRRKE